MSQNTMDPRARLGEVESRIAATAARLGELRERRKSALAAALADPEASRLAADLRAEIAAADHDLDDLEIMREAARRALAEAERAEAERAEAERRAETERLAQAIFESGLRADQAARDLIAALGEMRDGTRALAGKVPNYGLLARQLNEGRIADALVAMGARGLILLGYPVDKNALSIAATTAAALGNAGFSPIDPEAQQQTGNPDAAEAA